MTDLADSRCNEGVLDKSQRCIDVALGPDNGDGAGVGQTQRGTGVNLAAILDRSWSSLAVSTHAANCREVALTQSRFECEKIEAKPENWIGDRAYNDDAPDKTCKPKVSG